MSISPFTYLYHFLSINKKKNFPFHIFMDYITTLSLVYACFCWTQLFQEYLCCFQFDAYFNWLNSDFPFIESTIFSGVDSVGTVSASLVTYASIQLLRPDLIINAGTAGGFKVCSLLPRTIVVIGRWVGRQVDGWMGR